VINAVLPIVPVFPVPQRLLSCLEKARHYRILSPMRIAVVHDWLDTWGGA
jgi:hypothetical protein